ncbi:cytochrome P450 [Rickenella mellea]|uniref:Cytochrome P450 n=1 Tax=Rickenella mellea TaxID=50990 RepID=A0A4Y7QGL6_9AGAM|nr:cytochrome P450 [Rickenella mellea]
MSLLLIVIVVLLSILVVLNHRKRHRYPLPPGPPTERTWVGRQTINLPSVLPWKVYHEWSKAFGPVLSLSLPGTPPRRVILLSTPSDINNLYNNRSSIYCTRPTWEMARLIGRQNNVAFTPYGPRLKRARRFLHAALGPKEVESWQALLDKEVNNFLRDLISRDEHERSLTLSKLIDSHVSNTATFLTYGHHASPQFVAESEKINLDTGMSLIPGRWALEGFPLLKYLPSFLPGMGFKRWALQAKKRLDDQVRREFEKAKQAIDSGSTARCLVAHALAEPLSQEEIFILKCTAGSVYGAATDTTTALLHSALYILSLHPAIQASCFAHVGSFNRLPDASDEPSLPYFTAFIRELHRFRPVVNLIAHSPIQEDVVDGWRIEKGVWVIGNIWSVCHDVELYPKPGEFKPERHLDDEGKLDAAVKDPRDLTFGFGRRRCPGEHFANAHTFLFLSRFIYMFEVFSTHPSSDLSEKLEWSSSFISRPKKENFKIGIKLRTESLKEFLQQGLKV